MFFIKNVFKEKVLSVKHVFTVKTYFVDNIFLILIKYLPHFCSYLKYYTGRNKNVADLIINDLSLKIAGNKRSLQETYTVFLLFSEGKLHFIANYLNFSILIVLLSCFHPFPISACW